MVARCARVAISCYCILDFERSGSMISLVNGPSYKPVELLHIFVTGQLNYTSLRAFCAENTVLTGGLAKVKHKISSCQD